MAERAGGGGRSGDMTPVVDLTRERGTGPARSRRPVYVDLLAPCGGACPAVEDVAGWLGLAQAGRYREAWERIVADNPLPAVHGRVCYHPCEAACNRGSLDAAVGIHAVERFLGDLAAEQGWPLPVAAAPSGRRVLVVGAGPGGLAAAYHLRRLGHEVEVHEAGPVAGGMMHFGIPAYRLPRADLLKEVRRIEAMGVRFVFGHRVEDVLAEQAEGAFDAVFLAIGTQAARHVDIPARDAARVLDAVSLLHDVGRGDPPLLGRRVVVYGAGNSAMDAARTARRLGATETLIVYHRDRAHMAAHAFEADEAMAEGVEIRWLTSIKGISGQDLTVERVELDAGGRPQPTGRVETLQADAVVLALGQQTDAGFLRGVPGLELREDGSLSVDSGLMTGHPGIFAGGDMVPGERTVTSAMGHGKLAARHIDAWLRGGRHTPPPRPALAAFDMLHLPVFTDVDPAAQPQRAPAVRTQDFEEVVAGLGEAAARREAQRCLSCGTCYECDSCFAACPETAIIKLGPGLRYDVDYGRCTGCAVCFEVCPCHAIEMVPEPAPPGE